MILYMGIGLLLFGFLLIAVGSQSSAGYGPPLGPILGLGIAVTIMGVILSILGAKSSESPDWVLEYARRTMQESPGLFSFEIMDKCDSYLLKTKGLSQSERSEYLRRIEELLHDEFAAHDKRLFEQEKSQS